MIYLEYILGGLLFGATYSLVAIGFTLIFGVLNRLNIAHGAVIMVAAFAGATISLRLGGAESYAVLGLAFAASVVTGGILGIVVRSVAFAPLRNAAPLAPFVTSAAVAILLEEAFVQLSNHVVWFSPEFTSFPSPLENLGFDIGPLYVRGVHVVIFVIALILMAALQWWIHSTHTGMAIRAVEENPNMAWLLGINVKRIEIVVFAVASAIAGAAGCLIGVSMGTVNPFMGSNLLLIGFVIIVLAGLGSVRGAMICGLLVGVIETTVVGTVSASMKEAVLFIILFAVLVIRPQGLFSALEAKRD
ncbi:branched-chain amino acid transport system permease protein [Rhodoligotrophos appendicifer]|uniref:branched-chain amino acid ABC transporter permease n=1 Tax=Rhodoligotrophos appendicifer TaxID=987056 RepID=UPI0011868F03|nr:branched-chain amino acid ABC transporter permease [Rhodoligotrophos appendicifer]